MTFSATVRADILRDALAPVTALVNECKMHVTEGGIEISAVDPANVAMVDLDLDAGAFAHFDADGHVLGVNLERLTEIVSMADSDEFVDFDLDEERPKLHIEMGGLSFTMALIDPDSVREEPDLPDLELPGTFVFEGRELSRAVTAADLVSDHIKIVADSEEGVAFDAEGDTDDVVVTIDDDDLLSGRFDDEDTVSSLFSLDYLSDMAQPIDDDCEVSVLIGDELPSMIRYSMADGAVSVLNLLAPRISNQ